MTPDLAAGLFAHLTALAPLQTLIDGRVHPLIAPQGTAFPYLVYTQTSAFRPRSQAGGVGYADLSVQIDVYADTAASLREVADAVREGLDNFRGVMGTTEVRRISLDDVSESHEASQAGEETGPMRARLDFSFHVFESVPSP